MPAQTTLFQDLRSEGDPFEELPCGENCEATCEISASMAGLQKTLVLPPNDKSAELVETFFSTFKTLQSTESRDGSSGAEECPPDLAFAALFDFVVSAKYAERMLANGGWIYCDGERFDDDGSALYFPFIKACPRCSVMRGETRPTVRSNKPQSDTIGEIANDTILLIITELIKTIVPQAITAKSTNRRGDTDVVIYANDLVILVETKSSPLSVFPLEIRLDSNMTEVRDGERVRKVNHSGATNIQSSDQEIFFYLPHINRRISLGIAEDPHWPYPALIRFLENPDNVVAIVNGWKQLYDVYVKGWSRSRRNVDNCRWLLCGCGGGIDDSKNAPGLDRSDDIKKGTYQMLKFGTSYKAKCAKGSLRAALLSNFMAVRGYDRYFAELEDVLWTKEKYSVVLDEPDERQDIRAFRTDGIFNLYDAVITLTTSVFRDEDIRHLASLDQFMANVGCE